jgi:polysaccharide biosynthesis protein PslG
MRPVAVITVTFALLALALPAGASASPYVRYGVQDDAWLRSGPGTLESRLERLESLGVKLVRLNVLWSDVESTRGRYDWSGYDPIIEGLHERGIEPVLTLYSTPAWANGQRGTNWAPTSGATFAAFARHAAKRYPYVRRWLVWNEPNQRRWLRPTTPEIYVKQLLNPAYAAIHKARPGALVAGGVTAPRPARSSTPTRTTPIR